MDFRSEISKLITPRKTFMEILKVHNKEVPMANLLAYFFRVNESHGLKGLFIRILLETKYYEISKEKNINSTNLLKTLWSASISRSGIFSEVRVVTEERTSKSVSDNQKRIDILIETSECVICIEFKINHSLNNPLEVYQEHVLNKYKGKYPIFIVLTPNKKDPIEEADKYLKKGNVEFKQIIFSHFVSNVKEAVIKEELFVGRGNTYEFNIYQDFIRTIENRSVDYKIKELLLKFNYTIESLPFTEVPELWKNKINELKLKAFVKLNNEFSYHKKGCFVETKISNYNLKIRIIKDNWQIEKWQKNSDKSYQNTETKILVETKFNNIKKELNILAWDGR